MTTKHILVIDNEIYIQEVIKICLQTIAQWQVVTASSGQAGIEVAAAMQPDAILLDVMMPDMDGMTTFRHLQSHPETQAIPVILLTAKIQPNDRQHYTELGIKDVIAKPFDPLQLAQQIATILAWDAIVTP
jgi:CheY-like chemotaxis protein